MFKQKLKFKKVVIEDGSRDGNGYIDPKLPTYATEGSSGFDFYTIHDVILEPGMPMIIPTGWSVEIPKKNLEIQIRPRSGCALKDGLTVLNTPGTIDAGYRDEVKVITMPSVPTGLKIENGTISWNSIEGVTGYKLSIEFFEGLTQNLDQSSYKNFEVSIAGAETSSISIRDFSEINAGVDHCFTTALGKYKVKIAAYVVDSLQSAYTQAVGDDSENGIQG